MSLKSGQNKLITLKIFNGYEKSSRVQLINDIENYRDTKNKCAFIVNFHGAFYQAPNVHIILEYMNNGSLKEFIDIHKNGHVRIPERQICRIIEQILHGLCFIHNIIKRIHLDLKPENIFVNNNG